MCCGYRASRVWSTSACKCAIGYTSACSIAAGSRRTCPVLKNAATAGPSGAVFCRAAALGVILVIVAALGLFAWNQTLQARKANNDLREQRNQQEIANQNLQKELYKNLIALAERELSTNGGDIGLAGKALADCPESLRGWEWNYLMRLRDGERPALTGHESSLWTAQFSPDGKRIATASSDGTVKVWDSADRRCLKTLTGYAGLHLRLSNNQLPFLTVAFSPDGSRIAAGSMELPLTSLADPRRSPGLVKIWDAQTYKVLIEFNKQVGRVDTLAFSPDGNRIASSSVNDDHSFCVWDVNTGAIIKTVLGSKSHVHKLRFSPDGRTIAGGCTDGTLSFWDASTPDFKMVRTIDAHEALVLDVAFSTDGGRLATASFDGTAKVWDVDSGLNLAHVSRTHRLRVRSRLQPGRQAYRILRLR